MKPLLHRPELDDPRAALCGAAGYTAIQIRVSAGKMKIIPPDWTICGACEEVARQFGFGGAAPLTPAAALLLARQKLQEMGRKEKP